MEGQEHIHYAMPMLVMGYDYAAYKKQYDDNAGKYEKAKGFSDKDLFNLLEILLDKSAKTSEIKEKAIEYATEHRVEKTVIMTVAGATNCKMDYNRFERKGDADMCTVFEETRRNECNRNFISIFKSNCF